VCALKPALSGAVEAFLAHLDGYRLTDLVPDRAAFIARLEKVAAETPQPTADGPGWRESEARQA
jgi:Rrf2 family nitric oxide-sensitive transcriptional repressor